MGVSASIVIVTQDNLEHTRRCLESIYTRTGEPEFEVILVDNASQDGTPQYLQEFTGTHANAKVVLQPSHVGFARSRNIGAEAATGEYLVFLDSDVVVSKGWLPGLIRHLQDPQVGMVGPVTNASVNESQIGVDYQSIEEMEAFAESYTGAHAGQAFEIRMMPLHCAALRRAVFNEAGGLDEQFEVGAFAEDDLALRLKQAGYKILCAEDVFIHHWGNASISKLSPDDNRGLFKSNLRKFEDKWGVLWLPPSHRPELIPQQMRQYIEGAIDDEDAIADLSQGISDLRRNAEELQKGLAIRERGLVARDQEIANLSSRLVEAQQTIKWQIVQMKLFQESDGWVFLQVLLRFRRRIVPEGSRRERILQSLLDSIRRIKWGQKEKSFPLTAPVEEQGEAAQPEEEAQTSTRIASEEEIFPQPAVLDSQPLTDRFPWPLVSVILPVYNHADMLEAAARSVLESTYPNIELIILDDGSTDQIEPVLVRLANHPRVSIYRQPNQKLPRALTHAHQFARGQFVTWISSDNRISPATIKRLAEALLSHPEAVLVYADVNLIGEDGQPFDDVTHRPQNQDISKPDLIRLYRDARALGYEGDNYVSACFMYRREAAEALEGHYADDLRGLEDYDFWMRLQKSGQFYHLRNEDVLYFYRVHKRTMSHDILSQERQRIAHAERAKNLMDYEAQRRAYVQQRWTLVSDESLDQTGQSALSRVAQRLPVDYQVGRDGWSPGKKRLRFISGELDVEDPMHVQVLPGAWRLVWKSPHTGTKRQIEIWKGIELSPLAFKAREYQCNRWEFQIAGRRAIIGFHYGLAAISLDLQAVRQVIENNPSFFFVFVDVEGKSDPALGEAIAKGLDNAAYLGVRPYGEAYQVYACFDALWLPPIDGEVPVDCYRELLALAYAMARPFIAPRGNYFTPAPYQYYYHPPDESLEFISQFQRSTMDVDLLNGYLDAWTPQGCLGELTRLADAASQEMSLRRPDFRLPPLPVTPARRWTQPPPARGQRLKCGIVVNSLGLGGLEEFVAQMTRRLPALGIDPFVICTGEGGQTAETLKAQGYAVYIANGDRKKMRAALEKEKPDLLNSHLASLEFLQVADSLGIALVETIHSSYIWMGYEDWERERRRSRHFTHAIATSHTTRRYYTRWNNAYPPENITIIPPGIDPERIKAIDRSTARQSLGVPQEDYLFLNIASYDGNKNHMGMLSAFEQIASKYPQARLWFVGNVPSPGYFQEVEAYRNTLRAKDRIEFHPFRKDVSTLLSAADTFVINSFSEGWSLAATEALMAGVPLIHSECGSAYELVGDASERGIVVPNPAAPPINVDKWVIQNNFLRKYHRNTDALVLAMQKMIEESDLWRARSEQISAYACTAFSLENMLKGYLRIFQQTLGVTPE